MVLSPADWGPGCLGGKSGDARESSSDEESYVTACSSTPRPTRRDRTARQPTADDRKFDVEQRNRKYYSRTGNGGPRRRRRRRLTNPLAPAAPGPEPPAAADHPQRPAETTHVPIPVVFVLLGGYVLGGAAVFRRIDGARDWPSAVFVSLAALLTVGGWYPDDYSDVGGLVDARFVYASWVVVGLLLVSACIRLVVQALSASTCCPCCRRSETLTQSIE